MSHSHLPFKAKTVGAAALLAFSLSGAHAASLGKLTVLSSLGQPLHAEVELVSVAEGEASSLVAKLASIAAFQKAQVVYNPVLASLHFEVKKRRERSVISITSSSPINDPFIAMLMELRSDRGHLVREYTFLLDPPELRAVVPAQVVSPIDVPDTEADRQTSYAPTMTPQAVKVVNLKEPNPVAKQPSIEKKHTVKTRHRVRRGQSLSKIARTSYRGSVPLEQALVALYRANPSAFMRHNMNLLQVGKSLRIPSVETVRNIRYSEARQIIAAHETEFASYRQRLAGYAAKAEPLKTLESGRVAGGQIGDGTNVVAETVTNPKDRLKVSMVPSTEEGKSAKAMGAGISGMQAGTEAELADANVRIRELEKSINELEAMLQVRSKSLAVQQKQAESLAGEGEAKVEQPKPAATEVNGDAQAKSDEAAKALEEKKDVPLVAATTDADKQADEKPVEKPKPKPKPTPAPKKKESKSMAMGFIKDLMGNKLVIGLVGVLLLLLLMLRMRKARQKKEEGAFFDTDSMHTINEFKEEPSGSGDQVAQSSNLFTSPQARKPSTGLPDAAEVDALAEVDVYLAYGRENQAIEVLKNALSNQTERNDYRLKLLEIYAEKGDVYAFNALASELHVMTGGKGEEWKRAAVLGAGIAPNNPLFARVAEGFETPDNESGRLAPEGGAATPPPTGFDFSSVNLDLNSPPSDEPPAVVEPPVVEAVPTASAGRLEMDTKLDLIDTYLGIGDKEGARELLEEVLQKGSEEQVARAKEALDKL